MTALLRLERKANTILTRPKRSVASRQAAAAAAERGERRHREVCVKYDASLSQQTVLTFIRRGIVAVSHATVYTTPIETANYPLTYYVVTAANLFRMKYPSSHCLEVGTYDD